MCMYVCVGGAGEGGGGGEKECDCVYVCTRCVCVCICVCVCLLLEATRVKQLAYERVQHYWNQTSTFYIPVNTTPTAYTFTEAIHPPIPPSKTCCE